MSESFKRKTDAPETAAGNGCMRGSSAEGEGMNILIMSLTRMGDLVQATPLICGLRQKHPQAKITLMVSSDFAGFVPRIPEIDDALILDIRQFIRQGETTNCSWVTIYRYLETFLTGIRERQYDLVVNLSHSRLSALMIRYLNISKVCGFTCNEVGERMTLHPWMQYFGTELFNRTFNPFNLVEIFTRATGIAPERQSIRLLPPGGEEDPDEAVPGLAPAGEGELWIGIQAGSSLESRRWPAGSFAGLADLLAEKLNAKILLFGVASETPLAEEIQRLAQHRDRIVDCTGKTSIPQLIRLLGQCRYLVTNDTGTMHIAAALGTPIVGLFFAHAHPYETGPYAPGHLIFQARIDCAPCSYGAQCNDIVCIQKVQPRHLFAMIAGHMEKGEWEMAADMDGLDEMNVYATRYGGDQRLRLRSLIRHPLRVEDVFRCAYESLWIETLADGGVAGGERGRRENARTLLADHDCADASGVVLAGVSEKRRVLDLLLGHAGHGAETARKLLRLGRNRGNPQKIQAMGQEIEKIDAAMHLLGCTHPEIKPLVDLFLKRKENFQGDDLSHLAAETMKCYETLVREGRALGAILGELAEALQGEAHSAGETSGTSAMRAEVPGR